MDYVYNGFIVFLITHVADIHCPVFLWNTICPSRCGCMWSLYFNGHSSRWTWLSRYQNVSILVVIGAKDDGGGSDNLSGDTGKRGLTKGLVTLPQGVQEPLMVRDGDGRPLRGPLAVHCSVCVVVVHCCEISSKQIFLRLFIVYHLLLGILVPLLYSTVCSMFMCVSCLYWVVAICQVIG